MTTFKFDDIERFFKAYKFGHFNTLDNVKALLLMKEKTYDNGFLLHTYYINSRSFSEAYTFRYMPESEVENEIRDIDYFGEDEHFLNMLKTQIRDINVIKSSEITGEDFYFFKVSRDSYVIVYGTLLESFLAQISQPKIQTRDMNVTKSKE